MSYTTAINELRQMIADTKFSKRSTKKQLIGNTDGTNSIFYSYDKRLFIDNVAVYAADVLVTNYDLTDPVAGEFVFKNAPDKGVELRASYYWQWWTDDEITNFLNKGAEQIGISQSSVSSATPDQAYLQIPPGLKTPSLKFAAHLAMENLVTYMIARKHSSENLLEQDGNNDVGYSDLISNMQKQSKAFLDDALMLRDEFYKRQGRQFAPAFGIKNVNTRQYGPIR